MTNNPNNPTNNYDLLIDDLQAELLARDIDIQELQDYKAPKADPVLTGTVKVPKNESDSDAAVNKALLEEKLANKANQSDVIDGFAQVTGDISNINNTLATKASNSDVTNTINTLNSSIQSSLNTKAPIASPTFTGTPKAPNPSTSSDNTQIATKKYVDDAVNSGTPDISGKADKTYVDSQLSNKVDTTTMNTQLALKANLASPTFTGEPKTPTPANSSANTTVANKQYVDSAVSGKANTSDVTSQLALKAPLVSPTFTGSPKAPTPTSSSPGEQIVNKNYVTDAVAPKANTTGAFMYDTTFNNYTSLNVSNENYFLLRKQVINVEHLRKRLPLDIYYATKTSQSGNEVTFTPSDFGLSNFYDLSNYFLAIPDVPVYGITVDRSNQYNGTVKVLLQQGYGGTFSVMLVNFAFPTPFID